MTDLLLPLVESLINDNKDLDLSRVKIIGVQHILETTHAMFRSLYKLGLKPKNISLIGKCYSTCAEVYQEMICDGIYVSKGSFSYSSHKSYDEQFALEIEQFLSSQLEDLSSGLYERIIVLDDGGKCISYLREHFSIQTPTFAIEQTSSGYEAIRTLNLPFPVINVARSPLKLTLESPMIAEAAAERLYQSLKSRSLFPQRALIIGAGAIGRAMQKRLSTEMEITMFDRTHPFCDLQDLIGSFPLIIGCTGQTSISHNLFFRLSPGTTLVSVSSSDREFDAVHLRKLLPETHDCHLDLSVSNLLLVRSGFPVNFDGARENIEPKLIQLTIALITAGILQGLTLPEGTSAGIHIVNPDFEKKIEEEFLQSSSR